VSKGQARVLVMLLVLMGLEILRSQQVRDFFKVILVTPISNTIQGINNTPLSSIDSSGNPVSSQVNLNTQASNPTKTSNPVNPKAGQPGQRGVTPGG
jgi:hypothetical protein